jgi:hypothetical protein
MTRESSPDCVPHCVVAQPRECTIYEVQPRYPLCRVRRISFQGDVQNFVLIRLKLEHNEVLAARAPLAAFGPEMRCPACLGVPLPECDVCSGRGVCKGCELGKDWLLPMVTPGVGVRLVFMNCGDHPVPLVVRVEFAAP